MKFVGQGTQKLKGHTYILFCCCDLDLVLMISIYKIGLDILKMHLHGKRKFLAQGFQRKGAEETDQT